MGGRTASRVVTILVGVLAVFSVGGLITTAVIGVAGDKYGEYGEVAIPGSDAITLPAGEVIVSFHIRGYGGRGLTVPPLTLGIVPPAGVSDPMVTEDLGATVSVNDDARRRVWVMQVPTAGVYQVTASGPVSGYVDPRLAFGRTAAIDGALWVFVALSIVSVDLVIAVWWFRRRRAASQSSPPTDPYTLTDDGVRREQLKTIAALRDSGAMTEDEYEAEKRRIADGR